MTEKPLWLVDVDGVLNAVCMTCGPGQRRERLNGYGITWTPAVTDRILGLHTEGLVELRWLTTWAELANEHIGPAFGWPSLEVVAGPYDMSTSAAEWWKLGHVQALAGDRRIVWTDDDIHYDPETCDWLKTQPNILPISPNTTVGLTNDHIDKIEGWLRS